MTASNMIGFILNTATLFISVNGTLVNKRKMLFWSLQVPFNKSLLKKKVGSQFLAKDTGGEKETSSVYLKKIYKMQKNSAVRPTKFLT